MVMIKRYVAIVCNPKSGKGKPLKVLTHFENFLSQHGFLYQTYIHNMPKHLNGFTDLVILGGDGTINYVINHFKDITIPIGIIACGTGNDMAKSMHAKRNLQQQFEAVIFGKEQQVDAGICNDKLFLNGVGIGFDGWIVKRLLAKRIFNGKAAYYSTVLTLLAFYKESSVTICVDDITFNDNLFMLSAANFQTYGGGFRVAPHAITDDGLLDIITISKLPFWKRLKYLPVIEKGHHLNTKLPFVQFHHSKKLTLTATKTLHAHLDGEHMESHEFSIQIMPHKYTFRF